MTANNYRETNELKEIEEEVMESIALLSQVIEKSEKARTHLIRANHRQGAWKQRNRDGLKKLSKRGA